MRWVLELNQGDDRPLFRIYVSGDTLCRPWLREVVDRANPLDVAICTRAVWILGMLGRRA
jgi:hypothetical protein